jgi:hypothetical protein
MVVLADKVRLVMVDAPKNAMPVGTVFGFQFVLVLKLPDPGVALQVASWAYAGTARQVRTVTAARI